MAFALLHSYLRHDFDLFLGHDGHFLLLFDLCFITIKTHTLYPTFIK